MEDVLLPDTFPEQSSPLLLALCHLGGNETRRVQRNLRCHHGWMSPSCQGPTTALKPGGQEDVADGVAMAALPSCIVITCAKDTQKVERKVCGGKRGTGAWGREGTQRSPGAFLCTLAVQSMLREC